MINFKIKNHQLTSCLFNFLNLFPFLKLRDIRGQTFPNMRRACVFHKSATQQRLPEVQMLDVARRHQHSVSEDSRFTVKQWPFSVSLSVGWLRLRCYLRWLEQGPDRVVPPVSVFSAGNPCWHANQSAGSQQSEEVPLCPIWDSSPAWGFLLVMFQVLKGWEAWLCLCSESGGGGQKRSALWTLCWREDCLLVPSRSANLDPK